MPAPGPLSKSSRTWTRRGFLRTGIGAPLAIEGLRAATFAGVEQASPTKAESPQASAGGQLNYYPEGLYVWDTWYFTRGDEVHMIHLQQRRPGSTRSEQEDGALGHAMTTDLINWKELPSALYRGPEGSIDDNELWTGCTYEHEGKYYLYYTARTQREKGLIQRICLATSEDTIHWTKHPEPVIRPDPRWYTGGDCRDLIIQRHPQTGEFHGFYAAALPAKELVETTTIAHVRSRDLIHWTHEPPVFTPKIYGVVEVPDVFYLDGRWWMTCLTANATGARATGNDPFIIAGTIYASAERLEGPFREGVDNVLIGSMEPNGWCSRSVVWKGRRYTFYTQAERLNRQDGGPPTLGTSTTPKELRVSSDGRLLPMYSPLIEQRAGGELMAHPTLAQLEEIAAWKFGTLGEWRAEENRIRVTSPKSWSARMCGPEADSFILTADLRLERGRAIGLMFRAGRYEPPLREPFAHALTVLLDFQDQCVMFTQLKEMRRLDARRLRLEHNRFYRLRVIAKAEFFEVYVDDVLVLNFVRYQPSTGRFGLYVEAGEATFSQLRAVSLKT